MISDPEYTDEKLRILYAARDDRLVGTSSLGGRFVIEGESEPVNQDVARFLVRTERITSPQSPSGLFDHPVSGECPVKLMSPAGPELIAQLEASLKLDITLEVPSADAEVSLNTNARIDVSAVQNLDADSARALAHTLLDAADRADAARGGQRP